MDEKCRLPNESYWLKNESQYDAPTTESMEWSSDNITSWYSETFNMGIVLQDLRDGALEFSAGELPLCRSCFDRTFNYVQKAWRRCQSDAREVQIFVKNLPSKFPPPSSTDESAKVDQGDASVDADQPTLDDIYIADEQQLEDVKEVLRKCESEVLEVQKHLEDLLSKCLQPSSPVAESTDESVKADRGSKSESDKQDTDEKEGDANQQTLDDSDIPDEQVLEELHKELDFLKGYIVIAKDKQNWLNAEIQQELIKIRDLEFQGLQDVSDHEDLNYTLCSIMGESDYLEYLLSRPRLSPLVTISSTKRNFVYHVNNSRLSFDCCSEENLNWPEINSAWSILVMGMKAVESLLKAYCNKNLDSTVLSYQLKPLRCASLIHGKGISHVLKGYGNAIKNKGYLRAILAFAIYMKQICKICEDVIGPEYPLQNAPVEIMFASIISEEKSNITSIHMQSVVVAIVKCAKLFQIR